MVVGVIIGCAFALAFGAYAVYVTHHISIANSILDKDAIVENADGFWAKLNAKLIGWKTIVLGWVAALTQAFSFLLASDLSPFKDLPWTLVFEEKIANWITFVCAALIPITHAFGMKTAASSTPTE